MPHVYRRTPYFLRLPRLQLVPRSYGGDFLPRLVVCRFVVNFCGSPTVSAYVTYSFFGLRRWYFR